MQKMGGFSWSFLIIGNKAVKCEKIIQTLLFSSAEAISQIRRFLIISFQLWPLKFLDKQLAFALVWY